MKMVSMFLLVLGCVLALVTVLGAVMPFVPSGEWAVRVWDFPRVQLLFAGAVGVGLLGCSLVGLKGHALAAVAWWSMAFAVAAIGVQGYFILRYTPIWSKTVAGTDSADWRILMVNLDFENEQHSEVLQAIEGVDPDVMVLVEYSEAWAEALRPITDAYPERVEEIRGEGLGIALFSRVPLAEARIEHLVSDRRASIHAELRPEARPPISLVGLHPTPPALAVREGEGRYDSRIRDAELMIVADRVAADPDRAWIIAGDFNDVAWSHTTRLFERVSGLGDPRVGRGMYSTYHADYPLLRYPLDHIFLSADFGIERMGVERIPGSDHMGVSVDLGYDPRAISARPSPEGDDLEEAHEMQSEGTEDATEEDESAGGG